jgi:hypothetical protein
MRNIEQYKAPPKERKLQRNPSDALRLQLPDRLDGVPPLPL